MKWNITHSIRMLLALLVSTESLTAQDYGSKSKVITWQAPSANGSLTRLAVIGEVAKPGDYPADSSTLSVQKLVIAAGGVTDDASLTMKIVRSERVNQNLFFSPQADTPLFPGDLLIVESRNARNSASKLIDAVPRNNPVQVASAIATEPFVQLAFVNVLDHPVVKKVPVQDAQLEKLIYKLNQPIELVSGVKVLTSDHAAALQTLAGSGSPALADGSVIVFPRGRVDRKKLPTDFHASLIKMGAEPASIGGAYGQSPELRTVGRLAPDLAVPSSVDAAPQNGNASDMQLNSLPQSKPAFSYPKPVGPVVPMTPVNPEQSSARPPIATLPFTGSMPIRSSSSQTTSELAIPERAGVPDPFVPAIDASTTTSSPTASTSSPTELVEEGESAETRPFNVFQMLGIVCAVSGLVVLALVARKHFDATLAEPHVNANAFDSAGAHKEARPHHREAPLPPHQHPRALPPLPVATVSADDMLGSAEVQSKIEPNSTTIPAESNLMSVVKDHDVMESVQQRGLQLEQMPSETSASFEAILKPGSPVLAEIRAESASHVKHEVEKTSSPILATEMTSNVVGVASTINTSVKPSEDVATECSEKHVQPLNMLLKNRLPIREEATHFPEKITLQGHIQSRSIHRVDRPNSQLLGAGPHYSVEVKSNELPQPAEATSRINAVMSEAGLVVDGGVPRVASVARPHFTRSLSGQNRPEKREAASAVASAPASDQIATPFSDALRQLNGGISS